MNQLCKKFKKSPLKLAKEKFDGDNNIEYYAKKFKVTIYFYDGKLKKSRNYGPEMFVCLKNGQIMSHANPGILAKLPTGVNKIKGCKFKLSEILNCECDNDCSLSSNWSLIEEKVGFGINIWRKTSKGLNKSYVENIRRSKLSPAINLHCDNYFDKVYLITCEKLYFRSNRRLIN